MSCNILMSLVATAGTWAVTALGAATVIFCKKINKSLMNIMLGFAAGVMIAASFWSLLQPAIEKAGVSSAPPAYLVAFVGFTSGAGFMWLSDKIIVSVQSLQHSGRTEKSRLNRIIMLVTSITLHNIPEGLAVGVAFGALSGNPSAESVAGAFSVALGIGLQNFPEGAAVSLPLRREGCSRAKSFLIGQASGAVEPVAGVLGAWLVTYVEAALPYALSFAAGAMILVAVHELIPECQSDRSRHPYLSTMGIISGFAVMMLLDVMLG